MSIVGRKETCRRLVLLTARRVPVPDIMFFLPAHRERFPTCSGWNYTFRTSVDYWPVTAK